MKSWSSTITYTVVDMGYECETKEEYIEFVKQSFLEEHNIYLEDNEITQIISNDKEETWVTLVLIQMIFKQE